MRDFRDAKAMARALRDALKAKAIETTHTETLELIANAFGYENCNILSAKIEEAEPSASAKAPGSDDRSLAVAALLTREIDHRAKNILSVVQAIAHQTEASSVQEFIARFDERIRSLKASSRPAGQEQMEQCPARRTSARSARPFRTYSGQHALSCADRI
jgi:two-component sensor histidine kinase